MKRVGWLGWTARLGIALWIVCASYLTLVDAALFGDAWSTHEKSKQWVAEYVSQHHVSSAELRAVKNPLSGYLSAVNEERRDYYQAAMYAQGVAEWDPMRMIVESWTPWLLQCVVVPVVVVIVWRWFRRRRTSQPAGAEP
jgi:hypothetical protein